MTTLQVVLADDSVIIRAGLTRLLEAAGSFQVVAETQDPETLLREVALSRPDIAVVDIRMPPTHTDEGIRAARRIRREHPGTAVLVLSQYVETDYAMELLDGGQTHVGYLLKDRVLEPPTLLTALARIHCGEIVVDTSLISNLLAGTAVPAALAPLSGREREVLALMAEGLTDRGIAQRLTVTSRTIGTHIQHIFDKLEIANSPSENRRVHAVLSYLREI